MASAPEGSWGAASESMGVMLATILAPSGRSSWLANVSASMPFLAVARVSSRGQGEGTLGVPETRAGRNGNSSGSDDSVHHACHHLTVRLCRRARRPEMALQVRRVITGHDASGRAIVHIDELCKNTFVGRPAAWRLWQ